MNVHHSPGSSPIQAEQGRVELAEKESQAVELEVERAVRKSQGPAYAQQAQGLRVT